MRRKRLASVALLITMSAAQVLPAIAGATRESPVRLLRLETAEFQKYRSDGFDALYNLEYAAAGARFDEMRTALPLHPAGHLYKATAVWVDILNARRRLQTGIYRGSSFYAETEEKVDPRIDAEFRQLIKTAISLAEAARARNGNDIEALYYLGAAHGLLASYETTVARSFISALRNGSKAVSLHRKVIEIDPSFIDANLAIGTYEYIVGSLPFFVKVLAAIGGFRGSREKGIELLKLVAERGKYSNDDARVVLVTFLSREGRFGEALPIFETLASHYPRNYLLSMERAAALSQVGRSAESHAIFEKMLADPAMAKASDMIHFQYAETLMTGGRREEALRYFQAVTHIGGASADLVSLSHLRSGQLLDLIGRRSQALTQYNSVLARENVFDTHERARKYTKRAYDGRGE